MGHAAAEPGRSAVGGAGGAGAALRQPARRSAGLPAASGSWPARPRASRCATAAASFGSVIHVLADYGAHQRGRSEELSDHLEAVWSQLDFDANWLSAVERVEAESALERFVTWQEARPQLTLLGTEVEFSCDVDLGTDRVQLTGSADRVERDPDGRIRIVDFKTSKTPADCRRRRAARPARGLPAGGPAGRLRRLAGDGARPGGAELVYLRLPDGDSGYPKTFQQASLDDVPFPCAGRRGE